MRRSEEYGEMVIGESGKMSIHRVMSEGYCRLGGELGGELGLG